MTMDPRGDLPLARPGAPPAPEPALDPAALTRARGATLLESLERHLPGSREHADATASYAFAVAVETGADRPRAELVREAARLHEVGKVYLPTALLARPRGELSPEETEPIDSHPAYGAELAEGAAIPGAVCGWIRATAERFDGTGEGGVARERIALEARIIRVACAADSLLGTRSGSGGPPSRAAALAQLRAAARGELDPQLVEILAGIVERAAGRAPYRA